MPPRVRDRRKVAPRLARNFGSHLLLSRHLGKCVQINYSPLVAQRLSIMRLVQVCRTLRMQCLTKWTDVLLIFRHRREQIAHTFEPFEDGSDGESARINGPV